LVDTLVNDETLKDPIADDDHWYISTAANLNRKGNQTGLRLTESQITDLQTYLTDITGEISTSLTDTGNIAYLDTENTFTETQNIVGDGSTKQFINTRYGVSGNVGPALRFRGARGTLATPLALIDEDLMGVINFQAHTGVGTTFGMAARILGQSDGISSAGSTPGKLDFATTPTGSTTEAIHMSIRQDGTVEFVNATAFNANNVTVTNFDLDANATGNSVTNIDIADLANGTDGELITWDAAGAPAVVAVGTATHVLTSNGAGAAPTFQASPAGFADPMTTRGDIIYKNAGGTTTRLGAGTANQVLTSDGTDISWGTFGGGDTVVGTQVIEIDASALYPGGATPAAGLVSKQFGAQNQPIRAIQLSDSEDQEVYWQGKLNNWDAGTIKVKAYWFVENDIATPESTTFELDCSGVSLANFAGLGGTAYGTAITITDTTDSSAAEDKINISPASTAVTIAGAGAAEWLSLKMVRTASTDTAGNVFLAGISIEYTISTGTATV